MSAAVRRILIGLLAAWVCHATTASASERSKQQARRRAGGRALGGAPAAAARVRAISEGLDGLGSASCWLL